MDRYKSLLNLRGSAGKKSVGCRSGLLQGVLLIFVFLMVVFCGEDVVICVADVEFWQSPFEGPKIRHGFVKFIQGFALERWMTSMPSASFFHAGPKTQTRTHHAAQGEDLQDLWPHLRVA
jgi:hypothetical protein